MRVPPKRSFEALAGLWGTQGTGTSDRVEQAAAAGESRASFFILRDVGALPPLIVDEKIYAEHSFIYFQAGRFSVCTSFDSLLLY